MKEKLNMRDHALLALPFPEPILKYVLAPMVLFDVLKVSRSWMHISANSSSEDDIIFLSPNLNSAAES